MIYLDQAATSLLKPSQVAQNVYKAIQETGNTSRGAHEVALAAGRIVYDARERLAHLFGINDCNRIAFTSNATESLNVAIKGVLLPGDHVITTVLEHNSVLRPLYELEKYGVAVSFIPSDRWGVIDPYTIEEYIQINTRAVIATHSSNVTGNLVDIAVIGEICQQHGLIFIVDAAQTAGVFPIDVQKQGIDILCFTGHKGLLGPQGTGGIYVAPELILRPLKTGGSGTESFHKTHPQTMPEALEAGTLNVHGIAGLLAAVDYILEVGTDSIRAKEQALATLFYEGILALPGIKVYGDFSAKERSAIVSLNIQGWDAGAVSDILAQKYGICTRAGIHCAPLMHTALGTGEKGAIRFSFSHLNTEDEVNSTLEAIKELGKKGTK